ncbi:MAG: hypothetical protein H0V49_06600 [Nocardioidaceae bacterium]|nr:hypothetical protein [Nocardioidaceae bacterium]
MASASVIDSRPPLIVSDDTSLVEELLRLCAAASVTPEVLRAPSQVRRAWGAASCVLVGADLATAVVTLDLARRPDVILTSQGPETAALWQAAVALRADHVAVVPQAQEWLVGRLADSLDGNVTGTLTVAVIGARGGAGASTLAAGLAMVAARRGESTMLVDLDQLSGGIELLMGCEDAAGFRWPEVSSTSGRVSATALRGALPSADGVAVLSWTRFHEMEIQPSTARAMVNAGQRASTVVVLDLSRRVDDVGAEAISTADVVLLVSTCDVRSTAGAARMSALLRPMAPDVRLVVRTAGGQLDARSLAEAVQLPLVGTVPTLRAVSRGINDGLGPPARGRFAKSCTFLLDELQGAAKSAR